jgi:hypothetical protein
MLFTWKSSSVVRVSRKLVEHEKGIQIRQLASTDRTTDTGTSTFALPDAQKNFLDDFPKELTCLMKY